MSKKIRKIKKKKKSGVLSSQKSKKAAAQGMPLTIDQAYQLAVQNFQAGKLPRAEQLCQHILKADPDNGNANHLLGVIIAQQGGKNHIAIQLIRKAIQADPDNAAAHNNLGNILQVSGKVDEGIASYRKALSINPGYADAYNNLGLALKESGEPDEAAVCFRKALAINPNDPEVLNNLGLALQESNTLEEAIASFRKSLSIKPDNGAVHNNLGIALKKSGKLDEAIASYRKAVFLDPDNASAHNNLGNALQATGKPDEAIESYTKALAIKPDYAEAYKNLGNVLHELNRTAEALASYRRALSINPDFAEAHNTLGVVLRELGRLDEASGSFKKALAIKPDFAGAYKNLTLMRKYTELDDGVNRMEDLYAKKEIADDDKMNLGFGLGKVFEDLKDYGKSFAYMLEANRLKRKSYEYSIQTDRDIFARIRKTFSSAFLSSHHGSGNQDAAPLFILGMPRSGTTLVEQILASHPLVFGAGELSVLADLVNTICSGKRKHYPECIAEMGMDALGRMGSEYIAAIRKYSKDAEYITDKMPHNFLRVGLIRLILPNAKVIHCLRDPMDNCFSIFKKEFSGTHDYAYDMVELGQYYKLYRGLMAHWEKVLPGFMFPLRYEEMVADQEDQTRKLLAFCGLPWDEACLAFHKTERKVRTASLVQVRQPIYKDSVKRWKRYEKELEPLRKAIYG